MIDVLFFAELQDKVGEEKITVKASGISVKQLKDEQLSSYELDTLSQAMVAINEEYADENTILQKGDVVAFIPPVSGG